MVGGEYGAAAAEEEETILQLQRKKETALKFLLYGKRGSDIRSTRQQSLL